MLREGRPCRTQCQGGESERTRAGKFPFTAVTGCPIALEPQSDGL